LPRAWSLLSPLFARLSGEALENQHAATMPEKNPNQSKSCHFSCHHSCNFRMFITNRQAATAFQVRTAFTYAALISAVDPVAAGTRHFCHGKSPFLIGKPSINGPFSIAMLNSQMVNF